ncbi:MAG: hypothetical protein ACREUU_09155, partial [Gammaproteobacteria bacterium]
MSSEQYTLAYRLANSYAKVRTSFDGRIRSVITKVIPAIPNAELPVPVTTAILRPEVRLFVFSIPEITDDRALSGGPRQAAGEFRQETFMRGLIAALAAAGLVVFSLQGFADDEVRTAPNPDKPGRAIEEG